MPFPDRIFFLTPHEYFNLTEEEATVFYHQLIPLFATSQQRQKLAHVLEDWSATMEKYMKEEGIDVPTPEEISSRKHWRQEKNNNKEAPDETS